MSYSIEEDQNMPRKKQAPEEIVAKLRQVDVSFSHGSPVANAVRQFGGTEVTNCRWRQDYGGLKLDQVKWLTELALENIRLPKTTSDTSLYKLILKEAAQENC